MAPAVFKTDEAEVLGLAGSIPVRLRCPSHQGKRRGLALVTTIEAALMGTEWEHLVMILPLGGPFAPG